MSGRATSGRGQHDGMPTVARLGPYRLFFYSNEGDEPPHIHVERNGVTAKLWIDPVELVRSAFPTHETERIRRMVTVYQSLIEEAWNDHFAH